MNIPPLNGLPMKQYLEFKINTLKQELKEHEEFYRKIKNNKNRKL